MSSTAIPEMLLVKCQQALDTLDAAAHGAAPLPADDRQRYVQLAKQAAEHAKTQGIEGVPGSHLFSRYRQVANNMAGSLAQTAEPGEPNPFDGSALEGVYRAAVRWQAHVRNVDRTPTLQTLLNQRAALIDQVDLVTMELHAAQQTEESSWRVEEECRRDAIAEIRATLERVDKWGPNSLASEAKGHASAAIELIRDREYKQAADRLADAELVYQQQTGGLVGGFSEAFNQASIMHLDPIPKANLQDVTTRWSDAIQDLRAFRASPTTDPKLSQVFQEMEALELVVSKTEQSIATTKLAGIEPEAADQQDLRHGQLALKAFLQKHDATMPLHSGPTIDAPRVRQPMTQPAPEAARMR
jgi:hypothetical protein